MIPIDAKTRSGAECPMNFVESQAYCIPVDSFGLPENCPHRFIMVSEHFRQQIQCRPKAPELIVTSWEHPMKKAISQTEMQLHCRWISDSINLLKELCAK